MTNGILGIQYSDAAWWEEAADMLACLRRPMHTTHNDADLITKAWNEVGSILREGPANGDAAEAVSCDRWQRAERNCCKATDLIERLRRHGGVPVDIEPVQPMYQGALEHARGNFAGAITRYQEAEHLNHLHRHNWAVAILAQALAHLRQNLDDQVPEVMDALPILNYSEFGRAAEARWHTAQDAYRQRVVAPQPPVALPPPLNDAPNAAPVDEEVIHPNWHPVRQNNPYLLRVLIVIAVSIAVLGAVVVAWASGVSQARIGLIAYGVAFLAAVIVYFLALVFEKPTDVPGGCVALIDGPAGTAIAEGPIAFRGWPFLQRVRAIVPLNSHNYVSSKQRVNVRSDLTVEISLAIRYCVHFHGLDEITRRHNVGRAVQAALDLLSKPGASHRRPWQPAELRPAWQRKLLDDTRMTLFQAVPPLITGERLDQDRALLAQRFRERLQEKVGDWGIQIMGVWIAELSKAK